MDSSGSKCIHTKVHSYKTLLGRKSSVVYPTEMAGESLPDKFAEYFKGKVSKIHENISNALDQEEEGNVFEEIACSGTISLLHFEEASVDDINQLISSSSNASCDLDPIPTNLLQKCSHEILPCVTKIVNLSLQTATVPSNMKQSIIKPLIKKTGLDQNNLKNYRPVKFKFHIKAM